MAEIAEARAVIAVMNAEIKRLRSVAGSSRVDLIDKLEAAEIALDAKDKRIAELEAGGWQPIETAPKDRTPILAFNSRHPAHPPVVVVWSEEPVSDDLPDEPHWCDAATAGGTALYYNSLYFDCWQPLPAPPSLLNKEDRNG